MLKIIFDMLSSFRWKELRLSCGNCPLCGKSLFFKWSNHLWGVRCLFCGAAPNSISIAAILNDRIKDWLSVKVYLVSKSGPLFNYLKKKAVHLVNSYFDENTVLGGYKNGVQCQDLQQLTYTDNSFDFCVSSEVFEHVPDDRKAFLEILRVLKPGGGHIFTVPLSNSSETRERAKVVNGKIEHIMEPVYHGDSCRDGRVLCFRDYGHDIVERMLSAGYGEASIVFPDDPTRNEIVYPVVLGLK